MCGRYTVTPPVAALEARFEASFAGSSAVPTYNAAPSQQLPVILNTEPGRIQLLQWGLLPGWVRDVQKAPRPINARAETLSEKPSFRTLLQRRRALVLADSFYEWQATTRGKVPHRILLASEEPFAFAGLWDEWLNRDTGEVHPTFTIITTAPNSLMAPIHNRMPVLLPGREAELAWLDDGLGMAGHQELLRPYAPDAMREYVVSPLINSPAHNEPAVLLPAA
ncbi:putative SOS response-associated peptidase YedK [Hymenobacter luteus]|uniref:Abasic site processing protein n=2 Tax=Hymenobacter TaxID=89966 RepID=A0A7W9T226_9BACT|nr:MULTISPECIES: SOS response-associated peptidase [Hymenobacter]MBB4603269.1 putative SOS response-associated peptidase YedK [Hymenobacter latericoloratus]MBB6060167.1 putative SOS response-associated peptidase YedK [Hymenobacter luteus]